MRDFISESCHLKWEMDTDRWESPAK